MGFIIGRIEDVDAIISRHRRHQNQSKSSVFSNVIDEDTSQLATFVFSESHVPISFDTDSIHPLWGELYRQIVVGVYTAIFFFGADSSSLYRYKVSDSVSNAILL